MTPSGLSYSRRARAAFARWCRRTWWRVVRRSPPLTFTVELRDVHGRPVDHREMRDAGGPVTFRTGLDLLGQVVPLDVIVWVRWPR